MNPYVKEKFAASVQDMLDTVEAGIARPHGQDPVISALWALAEAFKPGFSFMGESGPEFLSTARQVLNQARVKGMLEVAARHSNRSTSSAARELLALLR